MLVSITQLHGYVLGFGVIGAWALVCLVATGLRLLRRDAPPWFWRLVSVAQLGLALQLLVGVVLLLVGRRPGPGDADGLATLLFHLSYGLISPFVVLLFAHKFSREQRFDPLSAFAVAGLVIFGLTFRAYQVGIFGS